MMARLPGLGPRSARRAVLHLIRKRSVLLAPLADAMQTVAATARECRICGNIGTGEVCDICTDARRANGQICVVEDVADLWAMERGQAFRGRYHVLGGTLSALDQVGPDTLRIPQLVARVADEGITEVILALNATVDGQTTAHYIATRSRARSRAGSCSPRWRRACPSAASSTISMTARSAPRSPRANRSDPPAPRLSSISIAMAGQGHSWLRAAQITRSISLASGPPAPEPPRRRRTRSRRDPRPGFIFPKILISGGAGQDTGLGTASPAKKARRFSSAISPIASRTSSAAVPRCGSSVTPSISRSAAGTSGSCS